MSLNDKERQALREAAERAQCLQRFGVLVKPDTVLALLDEIEALATLASDIRQAVEAVRVADGYGGNDDDPRVIIRSRSGKEVRRDALAAIDKLLAEKGIEHGTE